VSRRTGKARRRAAELRPAAATYCGGAGPEQDDESDKLLWEINEFDEDALDLVADVRRDQLDACRLQSSPND
jgi:hypothetical protein